METEDKDGVKGIGAGCRSAYRVHRTCAHVGSAPPPYLHPRRRSFPASIAQLSLRENRENNGSLRGQPLTPIKYEVVCTVLSLR